MAEYNSIAWCRICLEDGATIPIFEPEDDDDSIHSKLCLCLNDKIEDIDGYPRNICDLCHITLDTVYKFVEKYKVSCKVLENSFNAVIKEEVLELADGDEPEVEFYDLKMQPKIEFEDAQGFKEAVAPLKLRLKKLKKERGGKTKIKKIKKEDSYKNKTNPIASSILEGDFIWNRDKWCMKTKNTHSTTKILKNEAKPKRQTNSELLIPKVKPILKQEPRLCDLCGDTFKNQEKLKMHQSKVHFKPESARCPVCSKLFATELYMKKHVHRVHTVLEKSFVCNTCNRGFSVRRDLANHIRRIHNKHLIKKKEIACKICSKKYACAKSVLIHERSVHTGERPAVCAVCGSSFFHEDYLKEHMRLHTGETPFKCPFCERAYAQRGNMKSHLRNHRVSDLSPEQLNKLRPSYLKRLKH